MSTVAAPSPPATRKVLMRRALIRSALVAVLLGSILLANWSWNRLKPVSKQLVTVSSRVSRLADEAQQIDRRWDSAGAARVEAAYLESVGLLFTNKAELTAWQTEVEQQARQRELGSTLRFQKPEARMNGSQKFWVLPVAVDVRVSGNSATNATAYARLLGVISQLQRNGKKSELAELAVSGESNSVQHARAVYHLWAKEEIQP